MSAQYLALYPISASPRYGTKVNGILGVIRLFSAENSVRRDKELKMSSPPPYKVAHDLLVAGIGPSERYSSGFQYIARNAANLACKSGFDPNFSFVPDMIRANVQGRVAEASVLRDGANAQRSLSGAAAEASKKRVLAMKTLRHLYYHQSFGKQRVWILSIPPEFGAFPMEYSHEDQAFLDEMLNASGEWFDEATRGNIASAAQTALAWVEKATMVAGTPFNDEHRKLIRRWFVPTGIPDEIDRVADTARVLRMHLQRIAAGLKSGTIILTDSPHERSTNSRLENSGAFVFTQYDLMVIYIEKAFFDTQNILTGRANWARILVHELSHLYAKTEDHSYAWQGLLPRDSDVLKTGNEAALAVDPQFPTVRTLTSEQCIGNADSWAYFVVDCAGGLSHRDRAHALGQQLFQHGRARMEDPLIESIKIRIGMK